MAVNRVLKLSNRGRADFFEDEANGTNKISLRALDTLAGDVTFNLPGADGTAGQVLKTDGAGNLSFSSTLAATEFTQITILNQGELRLRETTGGGTNYTAHKAAATQATDLTYTWPASLTADYFLKTDGSGNLSWAAPAVTMQSAYNAGEDITFSAGKTLTLTQGQDETALQINKTGAGGGVALDIENDGTGVAVLIQQDGEGSAMTIDQNGDAQALNIDVVATSASAGLSILNAGTGKAVQINQTGAGQALDIDCGNVANSVQIDQSNNQDILYINKTGAGEGECLHIHNDGTGNSIYLEQHGNEAALYIDQSSAGGYAIQVVSAANSNVLNLSKTGAAAGAIIDIANSGTGYDIDGHSSNWYARSGGGILCQGLSLGTQTSETISSGEITITQDQCLITVGGEGGSNDSLDTINGGVVGQIIVLTATALLGNITVTEAGNINRASSGNFTMTAGDNDLIVLVKLASSWVEICRSNN